MVNYLLVVGTDGLPLKMTIMETFLSALLVIGMTTFCVAAALKAEWLYKITGKLGTITGKLGKILGTLLIVIIACSLIACFVHIVAGISTLGWILIVLLTKK
jgi:hypothetical protein